MTEALLAYLVLGAVIGVIAGLFGVGGGLIIVPALSFLFPRFGIPQDLTVHLAIGTSLGTIVMTSLSAIYAHHRRGAVRWDLVARMTPGIIVGAGLGALIAALISSAGLRSLFGIFEILVAAYLFFSPTPPPRHRMDGIPALQLTAAGGVIGTISSLLGIGGGTMTVPFLSWNRIRIQEAVATASACGLPIAVAGSAGFVVAGWGQAGLPAAASGYLYWPALFGIILTSMLTAPLGARLAHALNAAKLKRLFALLLLMLGLRMLLG
jgi:uncharacterized membrane protein YfcA